MLNYFFISADYMANKTSLTETRYYL